MKEEDRTIANVGGDLLNRDRTLIIPTVQTPHHYPVSQFPGDLSQEEIKSPVRGSEEVRPLSCDLLDYLLSPDNLFSQAPLPSEIKSPMAEGVISNEMSLEVYPFHHPRVFNSPLSDQEKGGLYPQIPQNLQNLGGINRMGTIIEGQIYLRGVRITSPEDFREEKFQKVDQHLLPFHSKPPLSPISPAYRI